MTTTAKAIFEGGVFRPLTPMPFPPGQEVDLTISPVEVIDDPILARMHVAKTLREAFAIEDSIPADPNDQLDIEAALNTNREVNGERLLFPHKKD